MIGGGMVAGALLASGCVSVPPPTPMHAAAPRFPVTDFFGGRSEGEGMLRVIGEDPRRVRVRSSGAVQGDGTIVLDQRIEEEGRAPRSRTWRLREVAPGRFSGSLTDASGPVRVEVRGPRLLVSYPMRGGLDVDQVLTPLPGGRALRNVLVVRKWGMPVAALDEMIVRRD